MIKSWNAVRSHYWRRAVVISKDKSNDWKQSILPSSRENTAKITMNLILQPLWKLGWEPTAHSTSPATGTVSTSQNGANHDRCIIG